MTLGNRVEWLRRRALDPFGNGRLQHRDGFFPLTFP
ncbi:hypothetical+protein [Methylocapsa aurea]